MVAMSHIFIGMKCYTCNTMSLLAVIPLISKNAYVLKYDTFYYIVLNKNT